MPAQIALDALYRDARARIARVAEDLTAEEWDTPVPGCPEWVARDLLAHLAGVATDVLTGRTDGSGQPHWTEAQVTERKGRTVDELLAEWAQAGPRIEAGLAERKIGFQIVVDALTHEGDLREGLGRPPADGWQPILSLITRLVVRKADSTLIVHTAGERYQGGEGEPVTELTADPYELFRGLTSRRSRAQMRAWNWTGDPTPYLESLPIFGPRDDDQPQVEVP
jgi:uncharacterized protein (TIGR03083 family)